MPPAVLDPPHISPDLIIEPVTYRVADLFAGAGGTSSGAEKAIEEEDGQMDLVAINHWDKAIATHQANHPKARHIIEDVTVVDPEAVVPEGYLDILLASPECKWYSRARGGKPIHDQGRMNPWAIMNWLTKLDVRTVLIENVPEFVDWGPLLPDGKPDPKHKGQFFQSWFLTLLNLGYQAEWRRLNAADYGDATTRIRFFLIARKDNRLIRWPEPTHAKTDSPMFPGKLPWVGARNIIDWSNPGRSLLDHPKYLKKPLSVKTRARIARGLLRFGGPLAPLYIRLLDLPPEMEAALLASIPIHQVQALHPDPNGTFQVSLSQLDQDLARLNLHPASTPLRPDPEDPSTPDQPFLINRHGENGSSRVHSIDDPIPTATGRGSAYLVQPEAEPFHSSDRNHSNPRDMEQPLYTITGLTGGGLYLVQPTAQPLANPLVGANRNNNVPKDTDHPVPAITTGGNIFLVSPDIHPFLLGQQSGSTPRSSDDPVPTIAGKGAIRLFNPSIIRFNGQSHSEDIDQPLSTVLTCNKHGLMQATLIEFYGDIRNQDVEDPLTTITQRIKHGLINPTLIEVNHAAKGDPNQDDRAHSIEDPIHTITSKRGTAIVNPAIIEVNHGNGKDGEKGNHRRVHSIDEPLGAITTSPGLGLAQPLLVQTAQTGGNGGYSRSANDPIPTITTRNDINVVTPTADPCIIPGFGEREGQQPRVHSVDNPLPSVTSKGAGSLVIPTLQELEDANIDPRRLVLINGHPYLLDIRFRMLQNTELARAMGFSDEDSSYEFHGTVADVTKQIGNAVPVHTAAALVRSIIRADREEPQPSPAQEKDLPK